MARLLEGWQRPTPQPDTEINDQAGVVVLDPL
jgi:hypothetical protein